ncbi:EndoU domain-containing protein [Aurantimicrobium sp. MWH-Uga1]|uniref:EndoU domain-containing protein n=1 Tax=Aurantimicrobium sp. MWH-Uga1 TaxID=2079575 RepID=UPI000DEE0800|nr:EndoU domain-containing protein [Aurantimicrobium sp. MWH-Uga1]AXE53963.1 hypothetical protein AURUGA1_00251 [Aurantimicrobium sp. MWH-Uga1]
MTFLDYSHVELTAVFIAHVLFGEDGDLGKGGHLSGQKRENKTEFPPSWDEERITIALKSVLKQPHFVLFLLPRIILQKEVDGVFIELVLRATNSGLVPHSAFPMHGEGVVQNILGQQFHLPQSNSRKGK